MIVDDIQLNINNKGPHIKCYADDVYIMVEWNLTQTVNMNYVQLIVSWRVKLTLAASLIWNAYLACLGRLGVR